MLGIITQKQCSRCKESKSLEKFGKHKRYKDGLRKWCRECEYKDTKSRYDKYRANEPERLAKYKRADYVKHKDEILEQHKIYYKNNKDASRNSSYIRTYGITLDDYNKMSAKQDGKCAICKKYEKILYVDHDHKTGSVRGLLCKNCNFGLGHFADDENLLTTAIKYIKGLL